MPDRLAEIRARLDAATPGPWTPEETQRGHDIWWQPGEGMRDGRVANVYVERDAHFIAHAPADIAWLLDEVERLREEMPDAVAE